MITMTRQEKNAKNGTGKQPGEENRKQGGKTLTKKQGKCRVKDGGGTGL